MSEYAHQAANATAISEPSESRPKVLVVDEELPLPTTTGKRIRTWNLLKNLGREFNVVLLCHGDLNEPGVADAKREIEAHHIRVELAGALAPKIGAALYAQLLRNCFSSLPYSVVKHATVQFSRKLRELMAAEQFDFVHCEWTPYAHLFLTHHQSVPLVVNAHNIETLIWKRRGEASSLSARQFFRTQERKMRSFERAAFARSEHVVACSAEEAAIARRWGARSVSVVHNGVDPNVFTPVAQCCGSRLVFIGSLDWFPNEDGVRWFMEDVLPLIRKTLSSVELDIVGRRPSDELRCYLSRLPGVSLHADVPDVREYLCEAAAVVVPLRIGGGTRIKIMEAMAAGRVVVTTTVGCEGIAVQDRVHVRIADTPEQFAAACCEVVAGIQERESMARAARELVDSRYSWQSAAEILRNVWGTVSSARRAATA